MHLPPLSLSLSLIFLSPILSHLFYTFNIQVKIFEKQNINYKLPLQSGTTESAAKSPYADVEEEFMEELPRAQFFEALDMREWEGYWLTPPLVTAAIEFKKRFEARDDDVLLASTMKTGTTWLKALAFCILHRPHHDGSLAVENENPHFLVPTVEAVGISERAPPFDVYDASAPRLLHTHLPHVLLPESVKASNCKIVYVARNPKDTVVSSWLYYNSFLRKDRDPLSLEEYVDCFCSGIHLYGLFVEHVAAYWEESKRRAEKLLFVKYEELKKDPKREVMKIAEFLGKPFEDEGEEAEEIVRRCSLDRIKNLEVNKSGSHFFAIPNSSFFRKGEVGDSNNYLTHEMEMQIHQTISVKLEALGLYF